MTLISFSIQRAGIEFTLLSCRFWLLYKPFEGYKYGRFLSFSIPFLRGWIALDGIFIQRSNGRRPAIYKTIVVKGAGGQRLRQGAF